MKVLHLSSGNLYGGVETYLVELAKHQIEGGLRSSYALTDEGRLSRELASAGAPVTMLGPVRIRSRSQVRQARSRLRDLLKSSGFDAAICHSQWAHTLFAPTIQAAGIPLVFYLHGDVSGWHWLELLARRTPPLIVLTNSLYTASTARRIFPGVPWEVLRYPVPGPESTPSAAEILAIREGFDTAPDQVVIVQTSRMEAWKGHPLLIAALGRMRDVPGWACWIAGGPQREKEVRYQQTLVDQCRAAGIAERVKFIGQREDIPAVLSAADIHCQPNLRPEPFGIVFIEALYRGLPVVTTAIGGPREFINPSCGILCPPGDPAALAEALASLVRDPSLRLSLGEMGPQRAVELCNPVDRVNDLLEVLRRLAPGKAGAR